MAHLKRNSENSGALMKSQLTPEEAELDALARRLVENMNLDFSHLLGAVDSTSLNSGEDGAKVQDQGAAAAIQGLIPNQ